MKDRPFSRRSGAAAPRMTVRNHVPLWVRIVVSVLALLAAAAAGFAIERLGPGAPPAAGPDVARLTEENRALRVEHDRITESSNTTDSRRAMEGSTIKELGEQIARLEADNARLKEDVAFFEAATADRKPVTEGNSGIAIRRFQIVPVAATRTVRYRILLTQDAKANKEFAGDLQLSMTIVQGGRTVNIALPESAGDASGRALVFRSYKRVDGLFELPPEATLKAVQVRILERGQVRVQQSVSVG